MRIYFHMLRYLWPYRWLLLADFGCMLLHMCFSLVNFTIIIPLLNLLFNTVETATHQSEAWPPFELSVTYARAAFEHIFHLIIADYGRWGALQFICAVLLGSALLASVFRYLSLLLFEASTLHAIQNLRKNLFHKVMYLPVNFFTTQKKGNILSHFSNDINEVQYSLFNSFKTLLKEPIMVLGYFGVLFSMSVKLSLITLLVLPLSAFFINLILKRLRRRAQQQQASVGAITSIIEESLQAVPIIKSFTAERYVLGKFGTEVQRYVRLNLSIVRRTISISPISEFLALCVICLLLTIGGAFVLREDSELSAAAFIAFLMIFSQVLSPFKNIANAFGSVQKGLAAAERILKLLQTPDSLKEAPNPRPLTHFQEAIVFEKVTFSYVEQAVLKNINLRIEKNKIIALVGPSGAGKSSLSQLIPRFYDATEGQILIDNHPITDYKVKDLRNLIGIVAQEVVLFHDTIFENIAFGKPNATEDEVRQAAHIANAHDFISAQPEGYETIIGEDGMKLSGGQRQRLNIARAIVKNPPILILDEATSALDSASEQLVQQALYQVMQARTCLVIAHRLSTIQNADKIIVLNQGEIIEQGTHSSLLKHNGLYKKLIDMQSFH